MSFPKDITDLAAEMSLVAVKHGARRFQCRIDPSFESEWKHPVIVYWEEGRHGAEKHVVKVTSEVTVTASVPSAGAKHE